MTHDRLLHHIHNSCHFLHELEGVQKPLSWEDLREQARLLVDLYRGAPHLYGPDEMLHLVTMIRHLLGKKESEKAAKRLKALV